jgi:nicotinate-nucleotide adenylyltransferase
MSTRIGILGGTFDPIHRGHLAAAAAARRALRLDRVLFVPSSIPPHRPTPPLASEFHRFAMVALAISGRASYEASDIELQMGGLSYTSRTLEYFASLGHPPSSLFFITGADAFADIDTWHAYPQLLERAHFVVVSRQGRERSARRTLPVLARYMREAARLDPEKLGSSPLPSILLVAATTPDVSSTQIRQLLERKGRLSDAVPAAVAGHIERHHLYEMPRVGLEPRGRRTRTVARQT